jgi:hypothetical protein
MVKLCRPACARPLLLPARQWDRHGKSDATAGFGRQRHLPVKPEVRCRRGSHGNVRHLSSLQRASSRPLKSSLTGVSSSTTLSTTFAQGNSRMECARGGGQIGRFKLPPFVHVRSQRSARTRTSALQYVCEEPTEAQTPLSCGLVANHGAKCDQDQPDVAQAQAEAVI